jgi:uncharacterized protein
VNTLLIFLKDPRPGRVKTRLIPTLGADAAAELYRVLAAREVRATEPRAGEYGRLFCFAPADAGHAVATWFPGETYWPQPELDLGARMVAAFAEAFGRGARRVAIIGTDVPWVSRDMVLAAFRALDGHEVAIGPARDGGYYLLALRAPQPSLFEGIAWSTPAVLPATLDRAARARLRVHTLPLMTDLDTLDDLRDEWPRIEPLLRDHPALLRQLAPLMQDDDAQALE